MRISFKSFHNKFKRANFNIFKFQNFSFFLTFKDDKYENFSGSVDCNWS